MSTIAEIEAALEKLTTEELVRVEKAVHDQFRQRGDAIVYDDSHGVESEADLIAAADEAFKGYDKAEAENAKRSTRTYCPPLVGCGSAFAKPSRSSHSTT